MKTVETPCRSHDLLLLSRYLLPALCHLSAEEGPRKVLLTWDTPALLVDFLSESWTSLKGRGPGGRGSPGDPSMETACSTLLNFIITETEAVRYLAHLNTSPEPLIFRWWLTLMSPCRTDPCFRTLETHLGDALPVLVNKPRLLVLAAYYCTLGLMIGRLRSPPGEEATNAV